MPRVLKILLVTLLIAALGLAGLCYQRPAWVPVWLRPYLPFTSSSRLYKWRDRSGQLQYSNQPPPAGTPYTTVPYWPDANVIPTRSGND